MDYNSKVCIIDDDEIYQFTTSLNLKIINPAITINTFKDGSEGINFIIENLNNQKDLPDIIFLDINMPVMDGFQFMEEYLKLKPKVNKKITIYMVSSSVDPIDTERSKIQSEISNYIIKPIKQHQLKEILERFTKNN